ncbi:hypothetical protein PsorP6_011045 [Peronosclerospora sorghi]|uniref:Uncharacterized protein n=1 Tax=Peronosclerospora sorghi TaxID=230839 RepID=A0ACC0VWF9_9STRA|nr:hypothetical protein PsorP6_011045 [Peronosclerospora sorghi]
MKFTNPFVGCAAIALTTIATPALAQQPGTNVPENHPPLTTQLCKRVSNKVSQVDQSIPSVSETSQNDEVMQSDALVNCVTEASSVVLEADHRFMHAVGTNKNCQIKDGKWDGTICTTPKQCAKKCGLEGAAYESYHGITTSGNELSLKLISESKMSARVYLLDASGTKYKQFQLLNQEFTFDVDMSSFPCGSNSALYFVKMDVDGGTARYPTNTAGAKYGTGYCDAQCGKGSRFIDGEANFNNTYGYCCAEMDIWESNSMATVYTSHACSIKGQRKCKSDKDCGTTKETEYTSWCDKRGCGYNPYRMSNKKFYGRGKGFDIDTTRPFTVVTQFITHDNTATGELVEIRRLYKQDNRVIGNPYSQWKGLNVTNTITDATCKAMKSHFGNHPYNMGDLRRLGKEMIGGMTLAVSTWVDYGEKHMSWLDSIETGEGDPKLPGAYGGPCPNPGGDPEDILANYPNITGRFSNIRSGDFGTTF